MLEVFTSKSKAQTVMEQLNRGDHVCELKISYKFPVQFFSLYIIVELIFLFAAAIAPTSPSPAPSVGANSDLASTGWFLLGALFIANLLLKPQGNGFWTRYNASIIIPLIVIIGVGMGFGMLRKSKELLDWQKMLCVAVEICALVAQDVLFLIHLFTTPDADAESAKN